MKNLNIFTKIIMTVPCYTEHRAPQLALFCFHCHGSVATAPAFAIRFVGVTLLILTFGTRSNIKASMSGLCFCCIRCKACSLDNTAEFTILAFLRYRYEYCAAL